MKSISNQSVRIKKATIIRWSKTINKIQEVIDYFVSIIQDIQVSFYWSSLKNIHFVYPVSFNKINPTRKENFPM